MSHIYYTGFTSEQFDADEYFQQWVLHAGEEHEQFWSSFQNLYPTEKTKILRARQLVRKIASGNISSPGLSVKERAAIKDTIFQYIGEAESLVKPGNKPATRRILQSILAVAALFMIALVATYLFIDRQHVSPEALIVVTTGN